MFSLLYNLIRLIARKGLPNSMMLTMRDHTIIVVPVYAGARPILISIGWDFVRMIPIIKKILQRKLRHQIEDFVAWNKKLSVSAYTTHQEVLSKFMRATNFRHALQIKPENIEEYCNKQRTPYSQTYSKRSLEMFVSFHERLIILPERARLIIMRKTLGGRKPRIDKIKTVKRLRKEGINGHIPSYRTISRIMRTNVAIVHRYDKYPDDMLLQRELEATKK